MSETEKLFEEYRDRLNLQVIEDIRINVPGKISAAKVKEILDKTVEEYEDSKVEAGEAVGLVSAESIGEPGTQMSLDYGEKVIIKTKNRKRIIEIGEFIDEIFKEIDAKRYGDTEVIDLPEDAQLKVPALGAEEKIEWKRVTALSRHRSPEKLLKLTTRSGRTITATPYHSFVIRKENQIIPVSGIKLKTGDRIPSIKHLPALENKNELSLKEILPKKEYIYGTELKKAFEHNTRILPDFTLPIMYEQINNLKNSGNMTVQEGHLCLKQQHGNTFLPEIIALNKAFGWLIGAYLAEGSHAKHYIAITNVCEEYLSKVIEFAKEHSINYRIKHDIGQYGKSTSLILNSKLLADLLLKTCGKLSSQKRIPEFAVDANEEFVSNLLQAYFDGDGNISVKRKVIRASSNSKELIDGIALLLNRLGIFSTKNKTKNQHTITISYKYAKTFLEKISFVIPYKKEALQELCKIKKDRNYDIIEMIPSYGDLFIRLKEKLNLPSRIVTKLTKKQKIGITTLKNYLSNYLKTAFSQNIDISKELILISRMLSADIVWDEITKMEYVNPSKEFVYDFSVEDLETFTTYDGIITHNTLNTFHFAGVAEMNVTTGLPRIIEILDGRKGISTPMMEIFLKKPYSTGKDIKRIALMIKETKVNDVAAEFEINVADLTIGLTLDNEKLKDFGLTPTPVIRALEKSFKIASKQGKDRFSFIIRSTSKDTTLNDICSLKEKIKGQLLQGIKGITQVLPIKRGPEFIIVTAGTNLKKVLELEFVDLTRTISNDIYEIANVLGIEPARQAIINEIFKVIDSQGLNIDKRHIMLVADMMCASGEIKGITRYGIISEKSSVLARASFETPIKHIIEASLVGEEDKLNSVVENVMLNQPVPLGTSLPGLVTEVKKTGRKPEKKKPKEEPKEEKKEKEEKKKEKTKKKKQKKESKEEEVKEDKPSEELKEEPKEEELKEEAKKEVPEEKTAAET